MNRAAQFALGAVILFVAIKLWWNGWFSLQLFHATGMQSLSSDSPTTSAGMIPLVIDSVCLVGIIGFSAFQFSHSLIRDLLGSMSSISASTKAHVSDSQRTRSDFQDSKVIDAQKLAQLLTTMQGRLDFLESLHPETKPKSPPTMDELIGEINDLKQRLDQANTAASRDSSSNATRQGDQG